jgi:hypothetical protein
MKKPTALFFLLAVAAGFSWAQAPAKKPNTPPPTDPPLAPADASELPSETERLDLYLLMGQSNMKGRGVMPAEPLNDPRIINLHLKTAEWFVARHPLHLTGSPETFEGHDNAGVGPGLAFAQALAEHDPRSRIGLVPCAVGGSAMSRWTRQGPLYQNALRRARLALASGPAGKTTIRGAIWLQGEADAREGKIEVYPAALSQMIEDLRVDLEIDDLPFIACTIGEMREPADMQKKMNLILLDLPKRTQHTSCVDARDLKTHIGDRVHFDTAAQQEMGRRFAQQLLRIVGK